jgi:predicted methyltransferase
MTNNLKSKMVHLVTIFTVLLTASAVQAHGTVKSESDKLEKIVAGKHRTASFAARDVYRHPVETLKFFGIKDTMTVVEISPGGGWYSEILAPYLKDHGVYIAAGYDPQSEREYYKKNAKKFQNKLDANPEIYGKTQLAIMQPPKQLDFAKADSADMILSFRNTHNWHGSGGSEAVYASIFKALKAGGIFGLVQHRAGHIHPKDSSGKMGYLKQSEIIKLAEKVGFQLIEKSNINANPKDTRDYENGVWTLPPSYRLKDVDRKKYTEIGESDRMTLKFVKPHAM